MDVAAGVWEVVLMAAGGSRPGMLFSILHCASRLHRELSAVLRFEGELKEWVRPEGKEMGEARWPGSDHGGSGGSFCWVS